MTVEKGVHFFHPTNWLIQDVDEACQWASLLYIIFTYQDIKKISSDFLMT